MVGTITRRMQSVLDGLQGEFKSLYSQKDLENAFHALWLARGTSAMPTRLKELFTVLDACGIPYEKGQDLPYYKELVDNANLPSFAENDDRMLAALYAHYEDYPTPIDYMERIVNRLCEEADGWQNDTLRLRILKQFIKYGNYLTDAGFRSKGFIAKYVRDKAGRKTAKELTTEDILAYVDDDIFAGLATATKDSRRPDGKYGLLKCADDLAMGQFRTEGATKKALYLFAMVYEMTFFTGDPDKGVISTGPSADGEVFPDTSASGEIFDAASDIETNLFRDYYTNNLMRFILDAYRAHKTEYEIDPSGQGINYKNFAEIVYLYYIAKKEYSPEEKIRRSSEMIKRLENRPASALKPSAAGDRDTVFYRNNVKHELDCHDIFCLPEPAFEAFLAENYNCTAPKKGSSLQNDTDQNTAFAQYESILSDLITAMKKNAGVEVGSEDKYSALSAREKADVLRKWLPKRRYGLWFTDVASLRQRGCPSALRTESSFDPQRFDSLIALLEAVNHFLTSEKALMITSPADVTRTSMIVVYYYFYNARNEYDEIVYNENDERKPRKSFKEVFRDFQRDLDPKLEAAHYQKLSGRNIFDVLVAFSAYDYQV